MKNANDPIENRTRDILACGALPQPSAPQRVPLQPSNIGLYHSNMCSIHTLHGVQVNLCHFQNKGSEGC
jgi:hypothetical protein